jgi:hypothetical protein
MRGMSPTYDQGMEPQPSGGGGDKFPYIAVLSEGTTSWTCPRDGFYDFFVWGAGGNGAGNTGGGTSYGGTGGGMAYAREFVAAGTVIPILVDVQSLTTGKSQVTLPNRTLIGGRGNNGVNSPSSPPAGGVASGGTVNSNGGTSNSAGVNGSAGGSNVTNLSSGTACGGGGAGGHPLFPISQALGAGGNGQPNADAIGFPGRDFGGGSGAANAHAGTPRPLPGGRGGIIITGVAPI